MSLFQCEQCGCVENTALSCQGIGTFLEDSFDWSEFPDRQGKKLCSACAPSKFSDGKPSELGKWHGRFDRKFLPMGMFKTNRVGNLEHIETGDSNYNKYVLTEHNGPTISQSGDL